MNYLTIHTHHQPPQRNPSKNTMPALPGFRARFTFHAPRFTRVAPACAGAHKPLHLSRTFYKSTLFMQNKPNLQPAQINVSSCITTHYENRRLRTPPKDKPNQTRPQTPHPNPSKTTIAHRFRATFTLLPEVKSSAKSRSIGSTPGHASRAPTLPPKQIRTARNSLPIPSIRHEKPPQKSHSTVNLRVQ